MELTDEERSSLERRAYDCAPTLIDNQVLEFCQQGFLVLEGVVPDEINRRTYDESTSGQVPDVRSGVASGRGL